MWYRYAFAAVLTAIIYASFQMAEVAVSGRMFGQTLARIARLSAPPLVPA